MVWYALYWEHADDSQGCLNKVKIKWVLESKKSKEYLIISHYVVWKTNSIILIFLTMVRLREWSILNIVSHQSMLISLLNSPIFFFWMKKKMTMMTIFQWYGWLNIFIRIFMICKCRSWLICFIFFLMDIWIFIFEHWIGSHSPSSSQTLIYINQLLTVHTRPTENIFYPLLIFSQTLSHSLFFLQVFPSYHNHPITFAAVVIFIISSFFIANTKWFWIQ